MDRLPKRGERINILWPGGPYNFVMEFHDLDGGMPPPAPGWMWVRGRVDPTAGYPYPDERTLYVRPTAAGYEMKPHGGAPMDIKPPLG